jgi:UDP-N-acetylmuramate--alanine ligase
VLCLDDPGVAAIAPTVQRPIITYGFGESCDVRAVDIRANGLRSHFRVTRTGRPTPLDITLNLPGQHNVLNALAAIALAHELEVDDSAVQKALAEFQGIDRRLQVIGEVEIAAGRVLVVDDYGHHPTEVAATMRAARDAWPGRRLVVAFQPHRYTRTRDLLDDFADVLSAADKLLVTEVYAAGEEPIAGADGRAICRAVRGRGAVEPVFVPRLERLPKLLGGLLQDGDVVLTLGAGDIGAASQRLPAALAKRPGLRRTS